MYALGMLFYKMLTGTPPFIHENPVRIVEMHEEEEPPELPERVPPTIKPVFYRMVSKDPERRPTAKKVISVLDLIQIGAKGWERRGAES
jgi:serine/threonine-protein kinase